MKFLTKFRILASLAALACGGDSTGPGPSSPISDDSGVISSLTISGAQSWVETGETVVLNAIAVTAQGRPVNEGVVFWQSSNPEVAVVASTGNRTATVTAVSVGVADVSAHLSGVSGSAKVTVNESCSMDAVATSCAGAAQIVYVRWSDGQLYRVRMDGKGLTQLTNTGKRNNYRPAWSPDGQRIAFSSSRDGTVDIYLMDADGSNVVRPTTGSGFASAAWSPDGRKLAVSPEGIYTSEIYLISANEDGASPVLLATNARSPAWSPDGKQIAYVHVSGDDGYHQVYIVNADGTDAHPITTNDGGGIYSVTWAPDGQQIAFSKCLNGCDIYVMNADGSSLRSITAFGNAQEAAWSPDGKWIAVSLWSSTTIAYVPLDGGSSLRASVSDGYHPSWRPY